MSARRSLILAPLVALAFAAPAAANVADSTLLSHAPSGALPNAPVTDVVVSGDGRVARYAAYVSKASNIAGGKAVANIFMVNRAKGWSMSGNKWNEGKTQLITKNANGDSWSPSFDGFDDVHGTTAPTCLAFVSKTTSYGGGSSAPDVFIKKLPSGSIKRLKGTTGASEVELDGQCNEIAYVRNGKAYVAEVDGSGRPHKVGGAGSKTLSLSANGENLTFERAGNVYFWKLGSKTRKLAAGTAPTSDQWGKYFAFERGGKVFRGSLRGGPAVEQVAQRGGGEAVGLTPNISAGGDAMAYAVGPLLAISSYSVPKGACTPPAFSASALRKPLGDVLDTLASLGVDLPDLPGLPEPTVPTVPTVVPTAIPTVIPTRVPTVVPTVTVPPIPGAATRAAKTTVLPNVISPMVSSHFNYVVYACEGGAAYLTWIGDFETGTTS